MPRGEGEVAPNPLHALALLPLYFKRPMAVDPLALSISATFVDIEVAWRYISGAPFSHGYWHSIAVAATLYPLLVAALVIVIERRCPQQAAWLFRALRWRGGEQRLTTKSIYLCALLGGVSHIFIDMWTHPESSYILWPFAVASPNPFYLGQWAFAVEVAVLLSSIYAVLLWYKAARD